MSGGGGLPGQAAMLTAEAEAVMEVGVGERADTGPTAFLLSKGTSSCSSVLLLYSGQFLKAQIQKNGSFIALNLY
jgi:hypothetical protein